MVQLTALETIMGDGSIHRSRDLVEAGVAATTIQRALASGMLERVSRGTYRRSGAAHEEGEQLAEAAIRVPSGVICLHSAAALHGLGDTEPRSVWLAIPHSYNPQKLGWPSVRWVRWRRSASFRVGVDDRTICGVRVRVTDPARTVIDMLDPRGAADRASGLACLRDYFAVGGSPAALRAIARALGAADRLASTLDVAEAFGAPS